MARRNGYTCSGSTIALVWSPRDIVELNCCITRPPASQNALRQHLACRLAPIFCLLYSFLPAIMLSRGENDNQISPSSASWCCKRIQDMLGFCGSINCSLGGCDIYQRDEERHRSPQSSVGRDDPTFAQCLGVASNNWQLTWPIENRVLGVAMPMEYEVIHYLTRIIKDPFCHTLPLITTFYLCFI